MDRNKVVSIALILFILAYFFDREKTDDEIVVDQVNALIAESETNPTNGEGPVRSVCMACGGWQEFENSEQLVLPYFEGYESDPVLSKKVNDARKVVMPFFAKHSENCEPVGVSMKHYYKDQSEWHSLDPQKREG